MASQKQQPLEHRLLLTATFCLLAGGAVMVYSASSARTLLEGEGDGTAYLDQVRGLRRRRARADARCSRATAWRSVRRFTPLILFVAFVLLVLVLVPGLGVEGQRRRRWLGAGPLSFQPVGGDEARAVLHSAAVLSARPKLARSLRLRARARSSASAGCAVLLILAQPDLGTALVICFTMGAMLVAAGLPLRQLGLVAGVGGACSSCSSRSSSPTGGRG